MKADMVWTFAADSGGIAFDEAWSPSGTLLGVAGLDEGPQIWVVLRTGLALACRNQVLKSLSSIGAREVCGCQIPC
jgi:hypothetical protein